MDANYKVTINNDVYVILNDGKSVSVGSFETGNEVILTIDEVKRLRAALLAALRHAGHELPTNED